ncbi:hypothetical protein C8Q70DRAFT_587597 [Cubamyces menziesii]|nr:hypothetical protein C8Q70DRAFT_587597 [Cubamyces menziesii]
MPREAACRNYAKKKVGCKPSPGTQACQRCIDRHLHCERPRNVIVPIDPESRKTSCQECRNRRIKCERQDVDAKSCFNCSTKGYPCSLDPQAASQPNPSGPSDAPTLSEQVDPTSSSSPAGQSRASWFDVVLSPSS